MKTIFSPWLFASVAWQSIVQPATVGSCMLYAHIVRLETRAAMKVRELIRLIEEDGWRFVEQHGSHRQYKHPAKPGRVTIPGKPGDDLHPKTLASVLRQAQLRRP